MKFCEYEYKRPNIDALCEKYTALCEKMAAANTLDEAVACVMEHERMTMEFVSDAELAEIRHTIDTRDKFYDEEKEYIAANTPRLTERMNAFLMMLLTSKLKPELEKRFPKVLFTNAEMSVKTVSPAVLGLLADEAKLEIDYQKLQASAQIEYDGKVLTLAQLGAYMENGDSAVRRSAFEATGNFYMDNADEFDRIFDELVKLRTEIAKKLGFETFTALGYLRRTRNCYDAAMVAKFREGVKKYIVPTVAEIKKRQAEHLGKEKIVYSDDAVLLPQGNPKPVGSFDETYRSGVALYRKMGSKTREFIDFMDESGLFDLEAKTGKAAGGYCTFIPNHHAPFVFSNFNGTAGDVEVFTHEGGHAFAAYVADKTCELLETGTPTYESAEVHSMSMEFLAWPWLDSFYGDKTETAKVAHLLSALFFLPYGAMVDEFQHIVYENPQLTPEQRNKEWAKLEKQYRPYIDFDGLPFYSDGRGWQRQLHIYLDPFYYIDYCLAQTVSLDIFKIMQTGGWDKAWEHYYAFLEKAGTLTFTELLEGAKLSNPFDPNALADIAATVADFVSGKY